MKRIWRWSGMAGNKGRERNGMTKKR